MAKKLKEQIDYGNTPERMDPSLVRKLASPDNLYAQNPAMKKGPADVQRLVSQRFQKVADKLRQVTGIQDLSSQQVQGMIYNEMMMKLPNIMRIEAAHKDELIQLAIDASLEEGQVPEGWYQIEAHLGQQPRTDDFRYQPEEPEDEEDDDEDDEDDDDEYLQEASADSTPYGNYINKARAKSHLTKKDGDVYGIDKSGKGHKITDAADLDKYTKFTIKSKELNEGKMYYHVLEDMGYGEIGHEGVYDTEEEAQDRANNLSRTYPDSSFYVEPSTSEEEPYNVTSSDYDPNLDIDEGKKETPIDEEIFGFPNVDINFPTLKTRYIAKKFAEYMSNKEGQRFTVTLNSPDGPSFDLDLDGEEYDGGSYLIAKNGDIINVALRERPVYGNISMLDETEKPKTKMKKSELKEKIKEMVLSEMESNNMEDAPEDEVDFLAEVAAILAEADKDEETDNETADAETTDTETADAEVETPEGTEDVEVTDTTTTAEVDPNVKAVQDALTQAQAAAQTLGDAKFSETGVAG